VDDIEYDLKIQPTQKIT